MTSQLAEPVGRFYETFAVQHDPAAASAVFVDGAIIHWQSQLLDVPHYQQIGHAFLAAFADLSFAIDAQLIAGDTVITRGTWLGTNTGSLMGMPVTGKRFRSAGMVIDTVVHGAIVERWELGDLLGMLQQLGLAPAT
jgi:predicted ester cyclase